MSEAEKTGHGSTLLPPPSPRQTDAYHAHVRAESERPLPAFPLEQSLRDEDFCRLEPITSDFWDLEVEDDGPPTLTMDGPHSEPPTLRSPPSALSDALTEGC